MPTKLYELAKELGYSSTELVEKCRALGFKVKGHMSSVDDEHARMIRAMLPPSAVKKTAPKKKPKPKKKKKKKPARPKAAKPSAKKPGLPPAEVKKKEKAAAGPAREAAAKPPERPEPAPAEVKPAAQEKKQLRPGELVRPAPKETVIQFKRVGSIPPSVETKQIESEPEEETAARGPRKPEQPGSQVESVVADSRWDKLQSVERIRSLSRQAYTRRPTRRSRRTQRKKTSTKPSKVPTTIKEGESLELQGPVTGRSISRALGLRVAFLLPRLKKHGINSINELVPADVAQLIGDDYGIEITVKKARTAEDGLDEVRRRARAEGPRGRSPVVTLMGHVDHGKTSLLDAIRQTNLVASEPGEITQKIGAYSAPHGDSFIAFIDTPGHEAFTEMRARGANVTDLAVIVIAADDGVMPQTEEAISHARAAGVPMIIALNKMDLPAANPMKAKQQLAAIGLQAEEWGGDLGVVEVSATTRKGLDGLLERIWLEAEMLELKCDRDKPAWGVVLDSKLTEGRGVSAAVLVRDGTLKQGDAVICGKSWGRVRMIYSDKGEQVAEAGPSVPVEIGGLSKAPEPGQKLYVVDGQDEARRIAEEREQAKEKVLRAAPTRLTGLEELTRLLGGDESEVKVVLKADTRGTLEALTNQVEALGTDEVSLQVLHAGVGAITAADVSLAKASSAMIVGFGVELEERARAAAESSGIVVRLHSVIYELVDEIAAALEKKLAPEEREVVAAHIEVRKIFPISRVGNIAGCYVLDGVVGRRDHVRVIREGEVIHSGTIASLRREKNDVREVRAGFECGVKIEGFEEIQEGDILETFRIEEFARKLAR